MKIINKLLKKWGLMVLMVGFANGVAGDTNTFWQIQSNAELSARLVRSNVDASANHYRLNPTKEQLERMSNAARFIHPTPWPDSPQKEETLKHCAELLRLAIDTNRIEAACTKMTNQPEAVLTLRYISKTATSNLNEFASLLTNRNLMTYRAYWAEISNPTNKYYFSFWTENGPVRDADKRPADSQRVLVSARFAQDGKLLEFRTNSPDTNGAFRTERQLLFNDDGTLRSHWMRPSETRP